MHASNPATVKVTTIAAYTVGSLGFTWKRATWSGRAGRGAVTYRASSGFRAELGLDFVSRSVIGTDITAGIFLAGDNSRLRFDLGWYFGQTATLVLGTGADLDGDTQLNTPLFDGGHGRFQMFW